MWEYSTIKQASTRIFNSPLDQDKFRTEYKLIVSFVPNKFYRNAGTVSTTVLIKHSGQGL